MGALAGCDVLLVFFRHGWLLPLHVRRLVLRGATCRVIDGHVGNRVAIRAGHAGHEVLLGLAPGAFRVGPCGILPANGLLLSVI